MAGLMAFVNQRWLKLPPTIGIMVASMLFSILLSVVGSSVIDLLPGFKNTIHNLHFENLVLHILLGFLLFAGAFHLDADLLKKELVPIITLSTVSTFISTAIMGAFMYYLLPLFHFTAPLLDCLMFAAVLSPTDPIAVLAILRKAGLNKNLEMKIAGESLFNDGVAVVVFVLLLKVSVLGTASLNAGSITLLFVRQALGGLAFGAGIGVFTNYLIRQSRQYEMAILITVGVVMGGYRIAELLELSGPLAMVVAGIVVGNKQRRERGMSHLVHFWEMMDEIFNTILFMLMGFEMLLIHFNLVWVGLGAIAIVALLLARWASVIIPYRFIRRWADFEQHAVSILTWGGLRGGLSVAMALSLPEGNLKSVFVTVTYVIVVFSIVVQGLTIGRFYRWLSVKK